MRRLLLCFSLVVIAAAALVAASLNDLFAHTQAESSALATTLVGGGRVTYSPSGSTPVWSTLDPTALTYHFAVPYVSSGAMSAAQWWRSAPTIAVAIATLAVLAAATVAARRADGYSPKAGRLLTAAGVVALLGGPLAVLIALLAPRFAGGDWARTTLWPQALLWALIGGALLAVHELLSRTTALRTELDGVI